MASGTVLVTGAASGIGRASVGDLLQHGYSVAAMDLDEAGLREAHPDPGAGLRLIAGDVSDAQACAGAVADTLDAFGALDALINWAAIHSTLTWDELTADEFATVYRVNTIGAFLMSQAAARHMVEQGSGAIVLTASNSVVASGVGGHGRGGAAYTSSKGAIIALTRALARSLGPHGIRVNAVSPGPTDTPMIAEYDNEARDGAASRAVLGRIGTAEDIATVGRFLITEDARHITGDIINANGGSTFS